MRFPPFSKELHIDGRPIKIHGMATGSVSVKSMFRDAKRKGVLAQIDYAKDESFTEWMPILTWAIEHPEGIWLIDTGENTEVMNANYFKTSGKFSQWLNATQFKFEINKQEEVHFQLDKLGIATDQIDNIILTHLHPDHVNGLKFFNNCQVNVHELEWNKPYGQLPTLYPTWFRPTLLHLTDQYKGFEKTTNLTNDGRLKLVFTPGHTYGHCAVLLEADEGCIFFAGDVTYNQNQLINNTFSAANADYNDAKSSYENIKQLASKNRLIFLPSHDAASGKRLMNMAPLPSISTKDG